MISRWLKVMVEVVVSPVAGSVSLRSTVERFAEPKVNTIASCGTGPPSFVRRKPCDSSAATSSRVISSRLGIFSPAMESPSVRSPPPRMM
jgi:hypothetical protein